MANFQDIIDSVSGSHVILDVNGVGYVVTCSARTLREMGAVGEAASLAHRNAGARGCDQSVWFCDAEEQDWFRLLTTVQGVGAKVALAIQGSLSPHELAQIIAAQDKTALTRADGVGPKLALRLVTELKDKVPALMGSALRVAATDASPVPSSLAGDALSALVNLGYRRAEAFAAVSAASRQSPDARLDDLIRLSLAELSRAA